jgi:hypothetical protein
VIEQRRAEGPLVVVDGGDSLAPQQSKLDRGGDLAQRRAKAELIADAYRDGGLDAMALGESDWALGAPFVRELVRSRDLPIVAANLTCGGVAPWPGGRVVSAGSWRIGVVGVTLGEVEGCEVGEPVPALARAVAELGQVDAVLALIPAANDRTAAPIRTERLPVDFALEARGRAASAGVERYGDTLWFSGGNRGKALGFATLSFVAGGEGWGSSGERESIEKELEVDQARVEGLEERLARAPDDANAPVLKRQLEAYRKRVEAARSELAAAAAAQDGNQIALVQVDLDDRIADHPATAERVAATKARVTELAAEGAPVDRFVPRVVTDTASPFAGGQVCASCHQAEQAQWATTPHARAWRSLVEVDRAMDDDCWRCHVTGASTAGGPDTPATAGGFHDIQCEACHGPGRAHAADPTSADLVADPPAEACTGCHDGVRDEGRGFEFGPFRQKVVHGPGTPDGAAPASTAPPPPAP